MAIKCNNPEKCVKEIESIRDTYQSEGSAEEKQSRVKQAVMFLMNNWKDENGKKFIQRLSELIRGLSETEGKGDASGADRFKRDLNTLFSNGIKALNMVSDYNKRSFSR